MIDEYTSAPHASRVGIHRHRRTPLAIQAQSEFEGRALNTPTHTSRLSTVEAVGLVDSASLSGLEALTRLAAQVLGVRVVLTTLVTDREQFLLCAAGPREPWASLRRIPLSHSFHRYLDDSARPLVLDDARLDESASMSLALLELGVIAYAGFPLPGPEGQVRGWFSAIDIEPRQWSGDDLAILSTLATAVAGEISLLLTNQDLSRSVSWLQGVLLSSQEGFFSVHESVNPEVLRQIAMDGEPRSSRRLIEAYLELADMWVAEFVAAAHQDDAPRMILIAHVLGPSSALLGAQPLADLLVHAVPERAEQATSERLVLAATSVSTEYDRVAAKLRAEYASSTIPAQRTTTSSERLEAHDDAKATPPPQGSPAHSQTGLPAAGLME